MIQWNDNGIVRVMHPICCGLDGHKEMIAASLIINGIVVNSGMNSGSFRLLPWISFERSTL